MPINTLSLAVVGADYPNKRGPTRRFAISLCRPGDPVQLLREPKNRADPNAVQVLDAAGVVMGYLSAERAPWIGGILAAGRDIKAIFQEPTSYGALIRVSLDDNEPDLPPAREEPNHEPDFYPDDIPFDEDRHSITKTLLT